MVVRDWTSTLSQISESQPEALSPASEVEVETRPVLIDLTRLSPPQEFGTLLYT